MTLDTVGVIEALQTLDFDAELLEAVADKVGLLDDVSLQQLSDAGVPGRTIVRVRRLLDPAVSRGSSYQRLWFASCVATVYPLSWRSVGSMQGCVATKWSWSLPFHCLLEVDRVCMTGPLFRWLAG